MAKVITPLRIFIAQMLGRALLILLLPFLGFAMIMLFIALCPLDIPIYLLTGRAPIVNTVDRFFRRAVG